MKEDIVNNFELSWEELAALKRMLRKFMEEERSTRPTTLKSGCIIDETEFGQRYSVMRRKLDEEIEIVRSADVLSSNHRYQN